MELKRLRKGLAIHVTLNKSGVWQCEFTHDLEGIDLGSYIEAGSSHLHAMREVHECVAAGLERWSRQPWALEMMTAPQSESEGLTSDR